MLHSLVEDKAPLAHSSFHEQGAIEDDDQRPVLRIQTVHVPVVCTLEELYTGITRTFRIEDLLQLPSPPVQQLVDVAIPAGCRHDTKFYHTCRGMVVCI
jgi:hypothetical protein